MAEFKYSSQERTDIVRAIGSENLTSSQEFNDVIGFFEEIASKYLGQFAQSELISLENALLFDRTLNHSLHSLCGLLGMTVDDPLYVELRRRVEDQSISEKAGALKWRNVRNRFITHAADILSYMTEGGWDVVKISKYDGPTYKFLTVFCEPVLRKAGDEMPSADTVFRILLPHRAAVLSGKKTSF